MLKTDETDETHETHLLFAFCLFRGSDLAGQLRQVRDPNEPVMQEDRLLLHRQPL